MTDNDETAQAIETIRDYTRDMEEVSRKIKALSETSKEIVESMAESQEVEYLSGKLAEAKASLKESLQMNGQYNDLQEEIANLREQLKDLQDILSQHLVFYFVETKERQVELNDSGDAREVIISGKLGKPQKFQTNLFKPDLL